MPSSFEFVPVPCYRLDKQHAEHSMVTKASTAAGKSDMNVYEGSYDLKYYLDRQPVEKPNAYGQKTNAHLN